MPDRIEIRGIQTVTHVGVPDEERALPQTVKISLALTPRYDFTDTGDDLSRTVDYASVAARVRAIAAERPRQLIETLAHETAEALLNEFPLVQVEVAVEKFILPGVDAVVVRVERSNFLPTVYDI